MTSTQIFTFDKSLQERLVEFTEILSSRGEIVPASQIRTEWSCHVELVLEPVGWRALWKIPRLTCQEFEVHYPTIVIVEVENVDFSELTALVKIVAVQEEIHLPEKYDVPLVELYPTLDQGNTALDMVGTAGCIDQLRFFFNYLWMPWDLDDDDDTDWVDLHLEPRIRLFFDMKRGSVIKETCDVIRTLIREGKDIQAKISKLEEDFSEEEEDQQSVMDEGKACQLMKLHFRLQQIKTEMEVLENPVMREMLARNKGSPAAEKETKRRESRGRKSEGYFVWLGGTVEEMITAMNKVQALVPSNMFVKTSNSLQEALDSSEEDDRIILGEGEHQVRGAGGLEEGGVIQGISSLHNTIICATETESGPALMDFSGGEVILDSLSIDLGELQMGLLVRKGIVKLNNCRIVVTNKSVIKLGVIVLPGAELVAESTIFEGLGTAIVVHSGGKATLNKCQFSHCVEGAEVHDNSSLKVTGCSLANFTEYGIRMETRKYLNGSVGKTGCLELLENISEIRLVEVSFENNGKGDVFLKPQASVALKAKQETAI